jgi:hypothetical protein
MGRSSIKSGNNLQFTLGSIPEVTLVENKAGALSQRSVWNKYLKKSTSQSPADLFVYRTESGWIFFNMDRVIEFIISNANWRTIPSGRVKGDFKDDSKKGVRQYLTYEYREKHKSHFLGANGNRGIPFIDLLKKNIPYHEEVDK